MNEHLPGYFFWLKQQGARFCHYKVCFTFDSSPVAGNIGKVIEIGRGIFGQRVTPLVVGAPELKRYTALDPENDRGDALDAIPGGRHRVGEALGRIAREAIIACGLKRAILAGGDTSSHALGQLDVYALTTRFPLKDTPGSPLCLAHGNGPVLDGLEIALKGGQVGGDDYFTALRDGTAR